MIKIDIFIRWIESGKRERTIAFEDRRKFIWTIDIDDPLARPVKQPTEHINDALFGEHKSAEIIEKPFPKLSAVGFATLPADTITKTEKIWTAYKEAKKELLGEETSESWVSPDMCSSDAFGRMGKLISEKVGCQVHVGQKYFRRLLQVGFKKTALIDRRAIYSGGEGKERKSPTGRRLGAYRKDDDRENRIKMGVPMSEDHVENARHASLLYAGESEIEIHRKMRENLYPDPKENSPSPFDEEVLVPKIESFETIPTPRQLSWWRKKHINSTDRVQARTSESKFNKNHRPKTGKVQDYASGCNIFAMDFTVLDCYPVSSLNSNQPIEKILAGVIFGGSSSYIPAVFAGPYDEGYKTVMLLMRNAFLPKGELCQRYGIKGITDEMWPGIFFDTLIYDKGPSILGKQGDELAERIAEKIGFFRFDTTASLRADLKGSVEKSHDIVRLRVLSKLPGFTPKSQERGDAKPKLKARVTAAQIYKLLLLHAYTHNFSKGLENYPLTEGMIADDILPIPYNILQWQIENEHGDFPEPNVEDVESTLLLPGEAFVKQGGIFFKNERFGKELQYICSEAEIGKWLSTAGISGTMALEIGYDPTDTDHIVLLPNSSSIAAHIRIDKPIRCDLVSNAAMEAMRGRYFDEVNLHHQNYQRKFAEHEVVEAQANATLNAHIEHEIKIAEAAYKEQFDGSSNRSRISGMKERTEAEKKLFEEKNKFQIFQAKPSDAPQHPQTSHNQPAQSSQESSDTPKPENKFRQAWKQEGTPKNSDGEQNS